MSLESQCESHCEEGFYVETESHPTQEKRLFLKVDNPTLYWLQKYKQKLFVWQLEYLALYNKMSRFLSKRFDDILISHTKFLALNWHETRYKQGGNHILWTISFEMRFPQVGKVIYFAIVNSLNKRNFILKKYFEEETRDFEEERRKRGEKLVRSRGSPHFSPVIPEKSHEETHSQSTTSSDISVARFSRENELEICFLAGL